MLIDRYDIEMRKHRGKLAAIRVIDSKEDKLIFRFKYPKTVNFDLGEFETLLYVFFNHEPKGKIEKKIRYHTLKLSGKYSAVYVCSHLLVKVRRKGMVKSHKGELYYKTRQRIVINRHDDFFDIEYDHDKHQEERDEFMYVRLKPYTIAKLCEIDEKTCRRMKKKIDIYLEYLVVYLKHKKKFDDAMKSTLATRKEETMELAILKKMLLNPFLISERVGRVFNVQEGDVRKYLMRLSRRIVWRARKDENLRMILLHLRYDVLNPFRRIAFGRKKKMRSMKCPRIEHKGQIRTEDEIYKN